jgi:ketosteroid isomerase-like protein
MSTELINRFYTAFQNLDAEGMASCYASDATFTDPVFGTLSGRDVTDMWRMLCTSARDFHLEFDEVTDTSAHWVATYTFSATGRRVVNDIRASFVISDGLIRSHVDSFSLWRWTRQALGPVGLALGWSPIVQGKVRGQAKAGLRAFQRNQPGG